MHGARLKYRPGTTWRWIEEGNSRVRIVGIRWRLKEDRWGHEASSLVIYEGPGGSQEIEDGQEVIPDHTL